jgi:hypothetical protein
MESIMLGVVSELNVVGRIVGKMALEKAVKLNKEPCFIFVVTISNRVFSQALILGPPIEGDTSMTKLTNSRRERNTGYSASSFFMAPSPAGPG